MTTPLLRNRRVLAAKAETSVGTAESLSASEAAFNVYDASIVPEIEMAERMGQGTGLSPRRSIAGARPGRCTFTVDLAGSGSAGSPVPAWASTFLPACGLVPDAVDETLYEPESAPPEAAASSAHTLTIGLYEDGRLKKLRGCMGTFTLNFEDGQPVTVQFDFRGIFVDPADDSLPAPDYPSVLPPRFAGATCALGAWSPNLRTLSIDWGAEVTLREDPTDASGYHSAVLVARRPTGSMDPEAPLVATRDNYGDWIGGTTRALDIQIGSGSADGSTIDIDAPAVQLTDIQPGDRDGVETDELALLLCRSADAGDD